MSSVADGHVPAETLEEYSMGRLAEAQAAPVEEHLLVCEPCRQALERADEFIRAARTAMVRLKQQPDAFSQRFCLLLDRIHFLNRTASG